MLAKTFGCAVYGVDASIVTIEMNSTPGNPTLHCGAPRQRSERKAGSGP
jgi:hypothetical protein